MNKSRLGRPKLDFKTFGIYVKSRASELLFKMSPLVLEFFVLMQIVSGRDHHFA